MFLQRYRVQGKGYVVIPRSLICNQLFAKRHQGKFHHFKMLFCKRDTDNGKEQQQAKNNMRDRDPDTAAKDPDDVEQKRNTAVPLRSAYCPLSKWPKGKQSKLKTLQPEGYAYDGKAKHKATYKITDRSKEAAEQEPDQVAQCIHVWSKDCLK